MDSTLLKCLSSFCCLAHSMLHQLNLVAMIMKINLKVRSFSEEIRYVVLICNYGSNNVGVLGRC